VPRMLVDARVRDLSVDVFGKRYASPLMMAPIGVIGICAQDGTATWPRLARPASPACR